MSDVPTKAKNILILCIDRDDDIGSKGGVETPIVGRDSCIHAGIRLAIEDPEDADSNAIFGAIKLYEELLSKGYTPQVALLSGTYKRGLEADEKIAFQLQDVLQKYKADGAIVVSDGIEDEAVLPIIQNMVPVISVQRIVIKHSRSVEYSYAVLGRYVKSVIYDSRYSRFLLGVPGALLMVGGITAALESALKVPIGQYALAAVAVVLGLAFILRGFDLDRSIKNLAKFTPSSFIKVFSLVAGTLIMLASIQSGYSAVPESLVKGMDPAAIATNPQVIGHFGNGMLTLLWIGIGTIFGGMLLSHWFRGSLRALGDVLRLVVLALFYVPMQQFLLMLTGQGGSTITLISSLLIGLALALVAAMFVYQYYRKKKRSSQLKH